MTKKRILIVEDQGIAALDEEQTIRELGYEPIGNVMTGEAAVTLACRDRPDLIIMDIKLMGDMDGLEATRKIHELYKIPVLYVTAFADKKRILNGNDTLPEGIGYLVKPFWKVDLAREIEKLIG